ncbi:CatB-related O-acetyltransferase [Roseivirga sp.]|uniref:CatB-related O-acetyltransferase n=1 Tax=Roseivirga sp. TaxID=1964215 RepID=UPI003B52CCC3
MSKLIYFWSKFFKKFRGKAIVNSDIHPTSTVEAGSEVVNSSFGKHSFCGYDCEIINTDIGAFCSIANKVIIGGGMHPMEWVSMSPAFYEGRDSIKAKFAKHKRETPLRTQVGNDVWIGECTLIKQGVSIGNGAVIGMGSVVTKDVAPYSIVAGVPAREIRKRFDEITAKKLLDSAWWDWTDDKIAGMGDYFNDPDIFLSKVES